MHFVQTVLLKFGASVNVPFDGASLDAYCAKMLDKIANPKPEKMTESRNLNKLCFAKK